VEHSERREEIDILDPDEQSSIGIPDNSPDHIGLAEFTPGSSVKQTEVLVISRVTLNYVVIAVTFLIVGLVIGFLVNGNLRDANQKLIQEAVDVALVTFQDAVGEEFTTALQSAGSGGEPDQLDPDQRYDVLVDDDPYLGPEDAPIVIVEFSDFRCTFCRRFAAETKDQLLEQYGDQIRFVYRDYPQIDNMSFVAAMAAECADDQGQFWAYHDLLFANQPQLNDAVLVQLAGQLEMDTDIFTACFEDQVHRDEVIADYNAGRSLAPLGTPTFFINGRPVIGARPFQDFVTVIEEELAVLAEGEAVSS